MAVSVVAGYGNNDGGSSTTTTTFDVVSDDLLVVLGHSDQAGDSSPTPWASPPISDNQTPDLTYVEIGRRDSVEAGAGAVIAYYTIITGTITGLTITLTNASGGSAVADSPAIKVLKFASGDYDPADVIGAYVEGNLTTDPQTASSITPETSGTGVGLWTDWNQTGTPTSSDLTMTGFNTSGDISGGSGYKTLTSGVGATANMNSGGTPTGNYLWFEVRASTGSPSASVSPSASQSPSASKSPSASASPSASKSPSASASPSASKSPSASVSPSVSPSASASPSASKSPSASPSPSAGIVPIAPVFARSAMVLTRRRYH